MHAHPRAALAMAAALASFITLSTVATPARAAFQLNNVGLQCSDSLVVQEGDAYVLSCTGDLSLQGLGGQGSFLADTSITLNATGSLTLTDLQLQAPSIFLNGGVGVTLDTSVTLNGADVQVVASTGGSGGTLGAAWGTLDIATVGNVSFAQPGSKPRPGAGSALSTALGESGTVVITNAAGIQFADAPSPGRGQAGTVTLSGSGDRDSPQGGQLVITNGGSLGSNDPKFGDVTLLTVGSAVPEASGWATMAIGLIALMGLVRRSRH